MQEHPQGLTTNSSSAHGGSLISPCPCRHRRRRRLQQTRPRRMTGTRTLSGLPEGEALVTLQATQVRAGQPIDGAQVRAGPYTDNADQGRSQTYRARLRAGHSTGRTGQN